MPADPLTATFAALADPTRRAILARLALGDAMVKELAEPFAISGPAVYRQLRMLERGSPDHPRPRPPVPPPPPHAGPDQGGRRLGRTLPRRVGIELRPSAR